MILDVSESAANIMLDALAAALDGGSLELLATNGQLLASLDVSDPGAAVDGELTFSLAEGIAVTTGEVTSARAVGGDGRQLFSCDAGSPTSDVVLKLTPTEIQAGGRVRLDSFRLVMP